MHFTLNITRKDLLQLMRERMVFLFLLIMPVAVTLLFGVAYGAFDKTSDPRLPVGLLDQDRSRVSAALIAQLEKSEVIRLVAVKNATAGEMERKVAEDDWAAALIIPPGFGREESHGRRSRLILYADTSRSAGQSVESEALTAMLRIDSALRLAGLLEQAALQPLAYDYTFKQALEAWDDPPVRVARLESEALKSLGESNLAFANISPGFMLQFAIAYLLTGAQLLVAERKSRSLQRLLTTAVPRPAILFGHYLAILIPLLVQFVLLLGFAQFLLGVKYSHSLSATLLIALTAALCIAALGLLIGVAARTEEQAVIFSLVLMFLLSILGGAWMPLEAAGEVFRVIGHLSPVAWALDGFKNVSVRGLGLEAALLPAAALLGYAALFYLLALWRFNRLQEK